MPAIAIQRFVSEKVPRECGAYLRRLCRGQVYCLLSLAGAAKLMLRWQQPEDLLFDFTWEHEMLFSMAVGHWLISLWEDLQCRSFLSGGLDSKALPGVRDPAGLLLKAFTLHHSMAALGYIALLHCQHVSAIGTLGLLFELPVLLLNRREILRLLCAGQRKWGERAVVTNHWRYVYMLFLTSRGGSFVLYVYSLAWWQEHLARLDLAETCLLHGMAIFFGVLNYAFLTVLDAWSRADAAAAVLPELEEEEDLERMEGMQDDITAVNPEAAILREVDAAELGSKDGLWLAIDGVVYDFTFFQHPGGMEVLRNCAGRDATADFARACPAATKQLSLSSMCRYQVGPLRLPPTEYRIFEHQEEERRMQKLVMALVFSLVLLLLGMTTFMSQAIETGLLKEGTYEELLLPSSVLSTLLGIFSVLLPMRQKLGACKASGGWQAHAIALLVILHHWTLLTAVHSSWPGTVAPQGLELCAVAVLLVETILAPAMTPPVLPVLLCLGSWYYRGLGASDLANIGFYLPWRKAMAMTCCLVFLTRLAQVQPQAVRQGLALCSFYGGLISVASLTFTSWNVAFVSPLQIGSLVVAAAASMMAHCAVLDVALQCSSRFATRWVAFLMSLLSFTSTGLGNFRWLLALALLHHLLDLARHNRVRMDQVATAGRFQSLDWHIIGAQALWDSARVSLLGFVWRTTVCNLQYVVTALIPEGLRVYACEVPIPNFGEKVAMGLAAQYVPPEARGKSKRRPNFFVCNVGQIMENCMPDMQHTMNTLVDVWHEFHEPKLPGLCANVVMVFPGSDQGLAKEINLSVWETGKDAFDWYVKSKGHKKALMQHTSGVLRTFGNLLASLQPREPISYQDRCSNCARPVEGLPGELAPNLCGVCGARAFHYNLF